MDRRTCKGRGNRESLLLVDNHCHTALAMLALRTINPHGVRVVDQDRVGRDGHVGRHDGHEA